MVFVKFGMGVICLVTDNLTVTTMSDSDHQSVSYKHKKGHRQIKLKCERIKKARVN